MLTNLQKRILLFLIFCIGIRTSFVFIAKNIDKSYLPYLGLLALIPATGMLYYYISGTRKVGVETFGEKIWWNNLRSIHSLLYYCFAISAFRKSNYAYVFLLIDVIIGLSAFIYQHVIIGK